MGYLLTEHKTAPTPAARPFSRPPRRSLKTPIGAPFSRAILSTKYWDADTKTLAYQLRDYGPGIARWLSRDPIGDEAFFRRYAAGKNSRSVKQLKRQSIDPAYLFCRNGPVSRSDILGLDDEPSNEECAGFSWWGNVVGQTSCWSCNSELTDAGKQMPESLQNCVMQHEGVHQAQCKKYGKCTCIFVAIPRVDACLELQADVASISCAKALLADPNTPPEDQLAVKCYLKSARNNCKNHKATCEEWANPGISCD